jgi:hypothetical protein
MEQQRNELLPAGWPIGDCPKAPLRGDGNCAIHSWRNGGQRRLDQLNQRFARAVPPDRMQLDAVMVRRMKSELKLRWDGSRRFAERVVEHLEVPYTDDERGAHKALQRYSELRLKNTGSDDARMATEFVLKLLKKRLFSSPSAFGVTLQKHVSTVGGKVGGRSLCATSKNIPMITQTTNSMKPKPVRLLLQPAILSPNSPLKSTSCSVD